MAAAAWDLLTVAQAKAYLNIGVAATDTSQDDWLQEIISDLSAEVEYYCKRKFAIQSISNEIYDGDSWCVDYNGARIHVNYFPITQLSTATTPAGSDILAAVQYRNDPDSSWTNIETDTDHIFINSKWDYIELYDEVFPSGKQNIRLNYKAGYSTIPQDIKRIALEMTAMMWKESNRNKGLLGESNKSDSGYGQTLTSTLIDLKPQWAKVLNRYRIPMV
jgi:hypothetical protein